MKEMTGYGQSRDKDKKHGASLQWRKPATLRSRWAVLRRSRDNAPMLFLPTKTDSRRNSSAVAALALYVLVLVFSFYIS